MWYDSWHRKGPFLLTYGPRIVYDSSLPMNAKLRLISNSNWSWPSARSDELVEIQALICDSQPNSEVEDITVWVPTAPGIYNANATWQWLRERRPPVQWFRLVWFKNATPKHFFIVWLGILNRLWIRGRMHK